MEATIAKTLSNNIGSILGGVGGATGIAVIWTILKAQGKRITKIEEDKVNKDVCVVTHKSTEATLKQMCVTNDKCHKEMKDSLKEQSKLLVELLQK